MNLWLSCEPFISETATVARYAQANGLFQQYRPEPAISMLSVNRGSHDLRHSNSASGIRSSRSEPSVSLV